LRHKVERVFGFEENHGATTHLARGDLQTAKMKIQLRHGHLGLAGFMEKTQDLSADGLHNRSGAGRGNGGCYNLSVAVNRQTAAWQSLHGRAGPGK
jgi:hypothetical protein